MPTEKTVSDEPATLTLREGSVGWASIDYTHQGVTTAHMYPLDDLRPHDVVDCWCHPTNDHEEDMYLHKALDNREWHFDNPFH